MTNLYLRNSKAGWSIVTVNFTMCRAIRLHGMRIKAIGRKLKEELQNTRGPFINTSKSFYMQKEVVQGKWREKLSCTT